jgi:hypothetical protein
VVVAPVKYVTWLIAEEPTPSLLLKANQSVARSCPLLTKLALGKLMTRELPVPLVDVEMLKLLPAVPVAMLLTKFWGMLTTRALPVPLVEVDTEKTSLTAVVVEMLLMMLVGRLMTKALVVVEMLKTSPAVVVETLAMMLVGTTFKDLMLLEASVIRIWEAEVEAMMTLPEGVTWKKDRPEVEDIWKIGNV